MQIPQNIPVGDIPSYFGLSKPISNITPIEGDKSTAIALAGAGNVLEGAVGLADTLVKEKIKSDVYSGVDERRNAETQALVTLRDSASQSPATSNPQSKSYDLFSPNSVADAKPDNVPTAIDLIPKTVSNLQSALQGGHIPLTYYRQQMDSFAKDMRSMYGPGYRPYVDEQFKAAGAGDTANEYLHALVTDIQRMGENSKSDNERYMKSVEELSRSGAPGGPELLQAVRNGLPRATGEQMLNTFNRIKWERSEREAQFNDRQHALVEDKRLAEEKINKDSFDQVAVSMKSLVASSGMPSTASISDFAADARAHPDKYTGPQYEQWAQMALGNYQSAYNKRWEEMNRPYGVDQRSDVQRVGETRAREILNGQLSPYMDVYKAFKDKEAGLAFFKANQVSRMLEGGQYEALKDPNMGPPLVRINALEKFGGNNLSGLVYSQSTKSGVTDNLVNYLSNGVAASMTPPAEGEKQAHLKTVLEAMQTSKVSDPNLPKAFFDNVKNIANPEVPDNAKSQLIKWTFDPENRGMLNSKLVAEDHWDGVKNKMVSGRSVMFETVTSPDITKEVRRLSNLPGNKDLWENYKNWTRETFALQLFPGDLATLEKYRQSPDLGLRWHSDINKFVLDNSSSMIDARRAGYRGDVAAQATVNRINRGLDNLTQVIKAENPDPTAVSAFLVNTLKMMNVNPEKMPEPGNAPSKEAVIKLMNTIGSTAKQKAEDFDKALARPSRMPEISNFQEDDKVRTLQDFLKNPDGGPVNLPREEVPAGKKWWGDKEAEDAGLYEPTRPKKKQ